MSLIRWIAGQPSFLPGDCVPSGRQNCVVMARFLGNKCKRGWFHYSVYTVLCNQPSLHDDTLKQKTCLLPV